MSKYHILPYKIELIIHGYFLRIASRIKWNSLWKVVSKVSKSAIVVINVTFMGSFQFGYTLNF